MHRTHQSIRRLQWYHTLPVAAIIVVGVLLMTIQSPHVVGLIRMGFLTGSDINLMHDCDLHPTTNRWMRECLRHQSYSRPTAMRVSSTEDTIWPQAILYMRVHVYEVTTLCVVSTIDDLEGCQQV